MRLSRTQTTVSINRVVAPELSKDCFLQVSFLHKRTFHDIEHQKWIEINGYFRKVYTREVQKSELYRPPAGQVWLSFQSGYRLVDKEAKRTLPGQNNAAAASSRLLLNVSKRRSRLVRTVRQCFSSTPSIQTTFKPTVDPSWLLNKRINQITQVRVIGTQVWVQVDGEYRQRYKLVATKEGLTPPLPNQIWIEIGTGYMLVDKIPTFKPTVNPNWFLSSREYPITSRYFHTIGIQKWVRLQGKYRQVYKEVHDEKDLTFPLAHQKWIQTNLGYHLVDKIPSDCLPKLKHDAEPFLEQKRTLDNSKSSLSLSASSQNIAEKAAAVTLSTPSVQQFNSDNQEEEASLEESSVEESSVEESSVKESSVIEKKISFEKKDIVKEEKKTPVVDIEQVRAQVRGQLNLPPLVKVEIQGQIVEVVNVSSDEIEAFLHLDTISFITIRGITRELFRSVPKESDLFLPPENKEWVKAPDLWYLVDKI